MLLSIRFDSGGGGSSQLNLLIIGLFVDRRHHKVISSDYTGLHSRQKQAELKHVGQT